MNLRALTLKYMGWCPGIEVAARFIPDREIPNKRVKQVSIIGGLIFLFYLIYYVVTPPRGYAWDLEFDKAKYDEVYKMYVRRAVGSFSGIYTMRMWSEAPENTTVIVQLFQRSEGHLSYYWTFRNGMFYEPGPDQPIGNEISGGGLGTLQPVHLESVFGV